MIGTSIGNSLIWDNGTNVGIGNTNTTYKLEVTGTLGVSGAATFSSSVTNNGLIFSANASLFNTNNTISLNTNDFLYLTGSSSGGAVITSSSSRSNFIAVRESSVIDFWTAGTERLKITSGGGVFINQTTGAGQLTVAGDTSGSFYPVEINQLQSGSASATTVRFLRQGGLVGTITTTNANTAYNTSSSDLRLKKNIENWDEIAIDLFKDINPKLFHFNNQEDSEVKTKGFIAQEMVDKFPEAYPLNGEGYYSFNPSGMVVYLVKAIQELKAEIDELKNK
jgi:hypothetical protein